MSDMIQQIFKLCEANNLNALDIKSIQTLALKKQLYDMVVYLNTNLSDYLHFVKNSAR